MQELPSYIPPGGMFDERGQPVFDPNGPAGSLVVPGYDRPVTLGELVQQREFPLGGGGWMLDYSSGTAMPSYAQVPIGMIAMAAAQADYDQTIASYLLLLLS